MISEKVMVLREKSSQDSTIIKGDENVAPKSWFHPFMIRDDTIPHFIIAKLNKALLST